MDDMEWRQVPVGLDAGRWITRTGCKTVLVVVHSVTTAQRLAGLLPLFESDQRVQVVFTAAPEVFSGGVARLLRRLDGRDNRLGSRRRGRTSTSRSPPATTRCTNCTRR